MTQSVSVFKMDRQTGLLTLVPSLSTVVVPRNVARFDDVAVTLSPNGKFLFVGMSSSFVPNRVLSYSIDARTGALTLVSSLDAPVISLPLRISQLAVAPGGNLLAVSLTSVAGYVALYRIDTSTGVLTQLDLLADQAPLGRVQGLAWSKDGTEIYGALVNNRPASIGGIGMSVLQNTTLGLLWTLRSNVSDDSNLIAVDPTNGKRLFFTTQMPAVTIATKPASPATYSVTITNSGFVPSLLAVEYGATLVFRAESSGLSVVQVSSSISCLPKAEGFSSGPLAANQTWAVTFDAAGTYFVSGDVAFCGLGKRLQVVVGSATDWTDPSMVVIPSLARATTVDLTFDGENLITSLQTGGFVIFRVSPNNTLSQAAVASYDAQGLQGTSSVFEMPQCCKNDASGPVLQYEPQVNVPCNYQIRGPFVKLVAGCDWLSSQLVTQGVQLPTCNAQCDALFRVSLTDLCGQTSVATQYVRHDPDVEPPLINGGVNQTVQCVLNQTISGNATRLQLFDQCQPTSSLIIGQQLGNTTFRSPLQCQLDKVFAERPVVWTVTDPCNNTATARGWITSVDTLDPVVSIADYVVPCPLIGEEVVGRLFFFLLTKIFFEHKDQCGELDSNGGTDPLWTGFAKAVDLCSGKLAVNFVDVFPTNFSFGCDSFVRRWTAVDFCGNVGVANQTISFERAQEPVFMVPANVTRECGSDLGLDRTGTFMIQAPTCVDLQTTIDTIRIPGGVCVKHLIRRFSSSKTTCGNWSRTAEQYITEVDTQGPVIVLDPLIHVTCTDGQDPSPNNTNVGYPHVFDACQGTIPVSQLRYVDSVVTLVNRPPHCLDQITRVWYATDVCGITSNATQVIYATRDCVPCGQKLPCKE